MKIAIIRFNQNWVLCKENFTETSGGWEDIYSLIKTPIERGHDVTLYTEAKDAYVLKDKNTLNKYEYLKKLKYKPDSYIDEDTDFLIIHNASTNMMYSRKDKIPFILWTYNLLKNYKGLVFYINVDFELPFTFNILTKIGDLPFLHCIHPNDIFTDKYYVICSKVTRNFDKFLEDYNNGVNLYKDLGYPVEYIDGSFWGFSEDVLEISEKCQTDLIYGGSDKSGRIKKIVKYFDNLPEEVTCDIYGKWSTKTKECIKKYKINKYYRGSIQRKFLLEKYNKSLCTVMFDSDKVESYGVLQTRLYELISCRVLVFFDRNILPSKEYLRFDIDEKFIIESQEELLVKIQFYKNNPEERIKDLNIQVKWLDHVSIYEPMIQIEKLYEKYKDSKKDIDIINLVRTRVSNGFEITKKYESILDIIKNTSSISSYREELCLPDYKVCSKCGQDVLIIPDASKSKNSPYNSPCTDCGGTTLLVKNASESQINKYKLNWKSSVMYIAIFNLINKMYKNHKKRTLF